MYFPLNCKERRPLLHLIPNLTPGCNCCSKRLTYPNLWGVWKQKKLFKLYRPSAMINTEKKEWYKNAASYCLLMPLEKCECVAATAAGWDLCLAESRQTRQTWQILEKIDKADGEDFLKRFHSDKKIIIALSSLTSYIAPFIFNLEGFSIKVNL